MVSIILWCPRLIWVNVKYSGQWGWLWNMDFSTGLPQMIDLCLPIPCDMCDMCYYLRCYDLADDDFLVIQLYVNLSFKFLSGFELQCLLRAIWLDLSFLSKMKSYQVMCTLVDSLSTADEFLPLETVMSSLSSFL